MQTFRLCRDGTHPTTHPSSVLNCSVFQSAWLLWAHLGWTDTYTERWHFNRILEIKVAVSFGLKWGKAHQNLYLHKFKSHDKSNPINVVPHVFPSPNGISCAAVYWSWPSWYYLLEAALCSSSSWMIIRVRGTCLGFGRLTHKFTRFIGKGLLVTIALPQDYKIGYWHLYVGSE